MKTTAALSNYIKPQVHDGDELTIVDGRHPVVERHCKAARAIAEEFFEARGVASRFLAEIGLG